MGKSNMLAQHSQSHNLISMTEQERAAVIKHITIWKETAVELDRIKWAELRALTEDQAAEQFSQLCSGDIEAWRSPDRENGAGLVEQQRWFQKAHARTGF